MRSVRAVARDPLHEVIEENRAEVVIVTMGGLGPRDAGSVVRGSSRKCAREGERIGSDRLPRPLTSKYDAETSVSDADWRTSTRAWLRMCSKPTAPSSTGWPTLADEFGTDVPRWGSPGCSSTTPWTRRSSARLRSSTSRAPRPPRSPRSPRTRDVTSRASSRTGSGRRNAAGNRLVLHRPPTPRNGPARPSKRFRQTRQLGGCSSGGSVASSVSRWSTIGSTATWLTSTFPITGFSRHSARSRVWLSSPRARSLP